MLSLPGPQVRSLIRELRSQQAVQRGQIKNSYRMDRWMDGWMDSFMMLYWLQTKSINQLIKSTWTHQLLFKCFMWPPPRKRVRIKYPKRCWLGISWHLRTHLIPSAAILSRLAVSFVSAQFAPRSPHPMSSAKMITKFGFWSLVSPLKLKSTRG